MNKLVVFTVILYCFMMSNQSLFAQDWANLRRYQKDNQRLLSQENDDTIPVVFLGNSITDHWIRYSPDFFSEHGYINRGISGQTTPQMLLRFQQDVVHLHPDAVVILAGTNDLAGNTGPSSLQMIKDNLISMVQLARANGIKVILSSILPAYDYPWKVGTYPTKRIIILNKWIKNYCADNGLVYLDYYTALVDSRGGMRKDYTKDGVHPNLQGYKIMEPLAIKAIKETLIKKKTQVSTF